MRVTISDQIADAYQFFAQAQGIPLDAVIMKQLARFQTVTPGARAVVLGAAHLDTLAFKLHGGDVVSAEDLLAKVDRLAGISFGGIALNPTPAQLEELAHRAERQGKPVEALIREIYDRLSLDFFNTPTTPVEA